MKELSSMELNGKIESAKDQKSEAAKFLGRIGGKASVKSRFSGKSKEEISLIMSEIRRSRPKKEDVDGMFGEIVSNMNKNTSN